jgi:hypothetical protein
MSRMADLWLLLWPSGHALAARRLSSDSVVQGDSGWTGCCGFVRSLRMVKSLCVRVPNCLQAARVRTGELAPTATRRVRRATPSATAFDECDTVGRELRVRPLQHFCIRWTTGGRWSQLSVLNRIRGAMRDRRADAELLSSGLASDFGCVYDRQVRAVTAFVGSWVGEPDVVFVRSAAGGRERSWWQGGLGVEAQGDTPLVKAG